MYTLFCMNCCQNTLLPSGPVDEWAAAMGHSHSSCFNGLASSVLSPGTRRKRRKQSGAGVFSLCRVLGRRLISWTISPMLKCPAQFSVTEMVGVRLRTACHQPEGTNTLQHTQNHKEHRVYAGR
jgi:hypothetical protein